MQTVKKVGVALLIYDKMYLEQSELLETKRDITADKRINLPEGVRICVYTKTKFHMPTTEL